ncbi:hypothetical protein [Mesorhizobium sp. KR9-304]|uniref:hypothetical protein n=1 Tax=Mesorhizobium sp. KR9-304 TaxID=3156614 RepID=UPI0032B3E2D0
MRKIPALLVLLAVASCTSTPQAPKPAPSTAAGAAVTLTDADRAAVEGALRARLTPTATIRTMIAQSDAGGVTVCGYVNSGSGDTPFIGMLVEGAFIVTDLGGPTERTIAVQKACHGRGIYI